MNRCVPSRRSVSNPSGLEEPLLRVSMDKFRAFHYHVAVVEAPVPMFSGRMTREIDVYYRLEVYTQTGSGGYDLMGLTKQQGITVLTVAATVCVGHGLTVRHQ